jgi:hypothetical protein
MTEGHPAHSTGVPVEKIAIEKRSTKKINYREEHAQCRQQKQWITRWFRIRIG